MVIVNASVRSADRSRILIGLEEFESLAFRPLTSKRKARLSSPLQPAGGAAWTGNSIVDHRRHVIVIITRKCGSVLRNYFEPPLGAIQKNHGSYAL